MKDEQENRSPVHNPERQSTARALDMGWLSYLTLCAIGLVIALTSIGPSASDGLGTINTMVFWAAHVIPAIALLSGTQMVLGQSEWVSSLPGIVQVVLSGICASILFAPIALGIDTLFAGEGSRDNAGEPLMILLGSELGHFFLPLVLIWTLINAPSLTQLERAGRHSGAAPEDKQLTPKTDRQPMAETAEFWSRVPGRLGRNLVALSAELHYLRVFTIQGETLILFPFGRAVDLLQDRNGMQVHRSHWVSLDHIDEVVTREGRTLCHMVGGPSLPVSRSYRSALRAARRGAN